MVGGKSRQRDLFKCRNTTETSLNGSRKDNSRAQTVSLRRATLAGPPAALSVTAALAVAIDIGVATARFLGQFQVQMAMAFIVAALAGAMAACVAFAAL